MMDKFNEVNDTKSFPQL